MTLGDGEVGGPGHLGHDFGEHVAMDPAIVWEVEFV